MNDWASDEGEIGQAQIDFESKRSTLIDEIEDLRRDLGMSKYDPKLDLMGLDDLRMMRDSFIRELEDQRDLDQAQAEEDKISAEREAEIQSLKHLPGEAEIEKTRVGLVPFSRTDETKMKLTKSQLQRIISEEVASVIKEMEIVNFDSGELLTVDKLPDKYAGRLTSDEDGHAALYDQDFEALRRDLELDPDDALSMLEDLAAEEMGTAQGDLGTAIDLAMGLKHSFPKEWKAATLSRRIKDMYYEDDMGEFDTINDALARFLAERMG